MDDRDTMAALSAAYQELVAAVREEQAFRPIGFDLLSRDILGITRSVEVTVLAAVVESAFGIKATSALERLLHECAKRNVSFDALATSLRGIERRRSEIP